MNPTPIGTNPELDALYQELAPLEEREIDAINYGRLDLLPSIRAEQIPVKARINAAEGCIIYPEAQQPEQE